MAKMRYKNRASPIDEYRRLRTSKGVFTGREAEDFYNKMVEMRNDPSHGSMTDFEIVTEDLGDSRGWSRGIGQKLPKSGYISLSSSPTNKKTYMQAQVDEMLANVRAQVSSEIRPIYKALSNAGIQIPSPVDGRERG